MERGFFTVALGHVEADVIEMLLINLLSQLNGDADPLLHRKEDLGIESPGGVV